MGPFRQGCYGSQGEMSSPTQSGGALLSPTATRAIVTARRFRTPRSLHLTGVDDILRELRGTAALSLIVSALTGILLAVTLGLASATSMASFVSGTLTGYLLSRRRNRLERTEHERALQLNEGQ